MIEDHQLARLVKAFTEAPSSPYRPQDIAIAFGEARIRYIPLPSDIDVAGNLDRAVYARLMMNAATLAASSAMDAHFAANESFNAYAMKAVQGNPQLMAVARLVQVENDRYTVEVRLLTVYGMLIARGTGLFSKEPSPPADGATETPATGKEGEEETAIAYGSIWRTPFGFIHQN